MLFFWCFAGEGSGGCKRNGGCFGDVYGERMRKDDIISV
jgi:hypothetical protein